MSISASDVKTLRERTGAGMMDCKQALTEAERRHGQGRRDPAREGPGASRQERRPRDQRRHRSRATSTRTPRSACSSRSTARPTSSPATTSSSRSRRTSRCTSPPPRPRYVSEEEIPEDARAAELRIFEEQAADKPENVRPKIAEGKLRKWMEEVVLLNQPHVNADKHEGKTIEQLRADLAGQDWARTSSSAASSGSRWASSAHRDGRRDPAFKRILLKLSGEALMGDLEYGTDPERVARGRDADRRACADRGVEVAIVVGAGNIYRGHGRRGGRDGPRDRRLHGDAGDASSTRWRCRTRWRSRASTRGCSRAITISEVAEPYIRRRAIRHLEKGRVVIFAAGTGNPFFTTDTAAALRAVEIHAEAILMAKNGVEGVYTADPRLDPDAEFIAEITHMDALQRGLRVMDSTALTLCMENGLPLYVFNMDDERNIDRIVSGERVGTLVCTT